MKKSQTINPAELQGVPTPSLHISWPIDRNLEVLSLTPCFSWVKTASEEVGTVSTVSTDCCKPLKRFWRRCHRLTQLKQGVNENQPVFGSRLSINRPPLTGFDSPNPKRQRDIEGQPHSRTLARRGGVSGLCEAFGLPARATVRLVT